MQLRVLNWNIQWSRGADGRVDLARTAAVVASHRPDVVCLQEVAVNHEGLPGGAGGDQPARLAALLPGYEAVYGVGSDLPDGRGGRRQFGQTILSRRPLRQVFRHSLPWPADPVVPSMPRVALEAVVDAPFGPLRLVTTHLEFYSRRQREAQVEALRRIHAEGWHHAQAPRSAAETDPPFAVLPRGAITLLCGDFNCAAGSPEYERIQQPFAGDDAGVPRLLDAWRLAHPQQAHAPTAGLRAADWLAAPACYDFCFVGENAAGRIAGMYVDAETDASDHQPVIVDLA